MGLRGSWAGPKPYYRQPVDDVLPKGISTEALAIYRRMRELDRQCECPGWTEKDGIIYSPPIDSMCVACKEWWQLNNQLGEAIGTLAWPVYENPEWERDYTPQQSAIDRFHALERAAKKTKKPKRKYKWQR